jgi:deoxyribodipyrimidine photolyase-related protein
MAQMYRTWMTMSDAKRQATLDSADAFLARLDRGARV